MFKSSTMTNVLMVYVSGREPVVWECHTTLDFLVIVLWQKFILMQLFFDWTYAVTFKGFHSFTERWGLVLTHSARYSFNVF